MNKAPSYKIIIPFVAAYTLCLFLPTIDTVATFSIHLFFGAIPFGVAGLIFPAIYPLSDSLTEVYGKSITYYVVASCYIVVIFFSLTNDFLLFHSDKQGMYSFMLAPSMALTIAGPISYGLASIINITLISKLKIYTRGAHFVIRSFLCSAISGAMMSVIVQPIVFYQQDIQYIFKITLGTWLIKLIVTIPFVYLAKMLVILYRYTDGVDADLYNKSFASNQYQEVDNEQVV